MAVLDRRVIIHQIAKHPTNVMMANAEMVARIIRLDAMKSPSLVQMDTTVAGQKVEASIVQTVL